MRIRTLLSPIICCMMLATVHAQKIEMPSKGNNIIYDGMVKMNHNFNGDFVCSKVKSWVINSTRDYSLSVNKMYDEGCTIGINASTIMDKEGSFSDVQCSFNITINITEEGLNYQLTDLVFSKAGHQYSVNEVYARYLKDDPYTKTAYEKKQAALRRHELLLSMLNKRIVALTESLKAYMQQAGVANK